MKKDPVITNETIYDGVLNILDNPETKGKLVVVFSSPYDLGRNEAIMAAVEKSGRQLGLGVRHSMIASRFETERDLLGHEAKAHDDFDFSLPPYGLYLTEGSKTYTATRALERELDAKGSPIYDRQNILKDSPEKVLLLNPFGNEIASLDNLPLEGKFEAIWSTSIMYSNADLVNWERNKWFYIRKYVDRMWAESNFWGGTLPCKLWQPKSGKLHRSGHGSPLELLWFLDYFRGQDLNILWHHTENAIAATKFAKSAFPKEKWNFVDRQEHYDPTKLPTKEKRWIGPLLRLDK